MIIIHLFVIVENNSSPLSRSVASFSVHGAVIAPLAQLLLRRYILLFVGRVRQSELWLCMSPRAEVAQRLSCLSGLLVAQPLGLVHYGIDRLSTHLEHIREQPILVQTAIHSWAFLNVLASLTTHTWHFCLESTSARPSEATIHCDAPFQLVAQNLKLSRNFSIHYGWSIANEGFWSLNNSMKLGLYWIEFGDFRNTESGAEFSLPKFSGSETKWNGSKNDRNSGCRNGIFRTWMERMKTKTLWKSEN